MKPDNPAPTGLAWWTMVEEVGHLRLLLDFLRRLADWLALVASQDAQAASVRARLVDMEGELTCSLTRHRRFPSKAAFNPQIDQFLDDLAAGRFETWAELLYYVDEHYAEDGDILDDLEMLAPFQELPFKAWYSDNEIRLSGGGARSLGESLDKPIIALTVVISPKTQACRAHEALTVWRLCEWCVAVGHYFDSGKHATAYRYLLEATVAAEKAGGAGILPLELVQGQFLDEVQADAGDARVRLFTLVDAYLNLREHWRDYEALLALFEVDTMGEIRAAFADVF